MEMRDFRDGDGPALRTFWQACGITIRPGDDDAALLRFATRNPGTFLLAIDERGIAGSALGGWDGRRGWLYHVAVRSDLRRRGVGGKLVHAIEERLRAAGCLKINLIVWDDNTGAMRFWESTGYTRATTVEFEKQL